MREKAVSIRTRCTVYVLSRLSLLTLRTERHQSRYHLETHRRSHVLLSSLCLLLSSIRYPLGITRHPPPPAAASVLSTGPSATACGAERRRRARSQTCKGAGMQRVGCHSGLERSRDVRALRMSVNACGGGAAARRRSAHSRHATSLS